jgi:hypothetical protein
MSHRSCAVPRARVLLTVSLALGLVTAGAQAASIGLNFTGVKLSDGVALNGGGYAPPDNSGGVGPNHVVQLINGAFAVYDKATGSQSQPLISGRQFWIDAGIDPGPGIANLGVFNQRVLFDPASGRWLAAALTGESINNSVLLARSDTSDPTGDWKAVGFLGNAGGDGKFVDYTRLGVDATGVYISTDNFNSSAGGVDGVSVSNLGQPHPLRRDRFWRIRNDDSAGHQFRPFDRPHAAAVRAGRLNRHKHISGEYPRVRRRRSDSLARHDACG